MVQVLDELSVLAAAHQDDAPVLDLRVRGAGVAACRSSRVWRRTTTRARTRLAWRCSTYRTIYRRVACPDSAPCSSTPQWNTARCPCRLARSSHQCTSTYSKRPQKQCIHRDHTRMYTYVVHSQQQQPTINVHPHHQQQQPPLVQVHSLTAVTSTLVLAAKAASSAYAPTTSSAAAATGGASTVKSTSALTSVLRAAE